MQCIPRMLANDTKGAPAIAIVAALALAVEFANKKLSDDAATEVKYVHGRLDYLMNSRPTAVDLSNAIRLLKTVVDAAGKASEAIGKVVTDETSGPDFVREAYIKAAEKILDDDLNTNLAIGRYGAEYLRRQQPPILSPAVEDENPLYFTTSPPGTQGALDQTYRKISVVTHCNTGSLATSGHGTALGVIRSLSKMNYLDHAYCTETRPYNQGARLTAFELVYEKISSTLITDSMAGALFSRMKKEKNIAAVIVGADRVARNGDTANKIGTYSLAVLAKYHGIKFVVAAPTTSIDLYTKTGADIVIEDRPQKELTQISGAVVGADGSVDTNRIVRVACAHQGIDVWNPSFDVTPHELIDAVITEKGEVVKNSAGVFSFEHVMPVAWKTVVEHEAQQNGNVETVQAVSSKASVTSSDEGTMFKLEHL